MIPNGRLSLTVSALLDDGGDHAATGPSGLHDQVASFFDDVAQLDPARFNDACRIVALPGFPAQVRIAIGPTVAWNAEDCALTAEIDFAVDAPCRGFSYALPDGRAVLNVSFDIPYRSALPDYIALAALQDTLLLVADGKDDDQRVRLALPDGGVVGIGAFLRQRLAKGGELKRLRWACLFEDPDLFGALLLRDAELNAAMSEPVSGKGLGAALAELARFHAGKNSVRYAAADLQAWSGAWGASAQALLFMSGFSQGVIDCLRQDVSEVDDGTDPMYPAADAAPARTHWLLYGNAHAIVEVVRSSRSAQAGRPLVGNCPYLLLVHLLSMDNEALVDAHEARVRSMVALAEAGVPQRDTNIDNPQEVIRLGNLMRELRLAQMDIIRDIEKHYHDDVFRYDTERAFFVAVCRARGIERRRHHLGTTTTQLTETVDQIAQLVSEREQRVLNLSVSALAVLSLFSLLVDVPGKLREWKLLADPAWQTGSYVAYLLILGVLAFLLWRTLVLLLRLLLRLVDEAQGSKERPASLWRQLVVALWRNRRP